MTLKYKSNIINIPNSKCPPKHRHFDDTLVFLKINYSTKLNEKLRNIIICF